MNRVDRAECPANFEQAELENWGYAISDDERRVTATPPADADKVAEFANSSLGAGHSSSSSSSLKDREVVPQEDEYASMDLDGGEDWAQLAEPERSVDIDLTVPKHVGFALTDTQEKREPERYAHPTALKNKRKLGPDDAAGKERGVTKPKSAEQDDATKDRVVAKEPIDVDSLPVESVPVVRHISEEEQIKAFLSTYQMKKYPFALRDEFLQGVLKNVSFFTPSKPMKSTDLNFKIEHSLRMAQVRAAKGNYDLAISRLERLLGVLNETKTPFLPYWKMCAEKLLVCLKARKEALSVGPAHASYAELMLKSNKLI